MSCFLVKETGCLIVKLREPEKPGGGMHRAQGYHIGPFRAGEHIFREGDPILLSRCFWASVQGIMEEMAMDKEMEAPDPEWIVAILRKEASGN